MSDLCSSNIRHSLFTANSISKRTLIIQLASSKTHTMMMLWMSSLQMHLKIVVIVLPVRGIPAMVAWLCIFFIHYSDIILGAMASQITSLTIVYSTVYSGADQRKHQSSASLAFVWGIHRSPVNSPHKGPVTRKMFHLMTSSWFWRVIVCGHARGAERPRYWVEWWNMQLSSWESYRCESMGWQLHSSVSQQRKKVP